jgi:hypothetical protein
MVLRHDCGCTGDGDRYFVWYFCDELEEALKRDKDETLHDGFSAGLVESPVCC